MAARLLGVTTATIRRWDAEGKMPPAMRTLGGQRRYRRSDLEALAASLGLAPERQA